MMRIVAVDLGGSGLKAGLFEADGALVAEARVPLGFEDGADGASEADPAAWVRALDRALDGLGDVAGVVALVVTSFTRTHVFADATGAAVRPAMGFRDVRAAGIAQALRARAAEHDEAAHLGAHHPLARLAWLRAAEPAAFARVRLVLEPKDFLALRLTGVAATDAVASARLVAATAGRPSLAELLDLPVPPLSALVAPGAVIGRVRAGPLAGAAMVMAAHDSWTAVLGLGALRPGAAYGVAGTTEVTGLLADRAAAAPGLMTVRWGDGLWQVGGPSQNGGETLAWALRLVGAAAADLDRLLGAAQGPPLLVLPYLRGERVPHQDARLRAGLFGLDARHGPEDLLRGVLEGLALASRDVLERAEAAADLRADAVRIAGGPVASAAWRQLRADLLQRPLLVMPGEEAGLRGGLALARTALGLDPDPVTAADRIAGTPLRVLPDPARAAYSDALFDLFRRTAAPVAAISHALHALPS